MIKALNHVGIAVKDLDESVALYERLLGVKPQSIEEVPHLKIKVAFFEVGGVHFELLQATAPDIDISRYIESHGQGVHHLCFEVDDINAELAAMPGRGIEVLDEKGKTGFLGQIGFLNPKSTNDVLIELVEPKK